MAFLLLGIALLLAKYLGWSALEEVSWWWLLIPFGLAAAWWSWADMSGYTKRKRFQQMEDRKSERLKKLKQNLSAGGQDRRR